MAEQKVSIVYTVKDQASKALDGISGKFQNLSKFVFSASGLMTGLLSGAIFKVGQTFLKAGAQLESYTASFEVMLGSADKAKKLMSEINKVAAETPFEPTDIIKSTQALLAYGVAEKDVMDTFSVLGDISQGNAEKLDGLTIAYGKVQTKGKASMEEINMVAEKGVPIYDALAKQMGVSKTEVAKMASTGKISADVFNLAMKSMTLEGGVFYQSMIKQSKTMSGLWSTVTGNISQMAGEIGLMLLPKAKELAIGFNSFLNSVMAFVSSSTFKSYLDILVKTFGSLVGVIINLVSIANNLGIFKAVGAIFLGISSIMGFVLDKLEKLTKGIAKISEVVGGVMSKLGLGKDQPASADEPLEEDPTQPNETELAKIEKARLLAEKEKEVVLETQKQTLAEKEKLQKEADNKRLEMGRSYTDAVSKAAETEGDIVKATAQGSLEFVKQQLLAEVKARAARLFAEGFAELPLLLTGNPSGPLKIAAAGAMTAAGTSAINAIKLAQGGQFDVNSPTMVGPGVMAGEAGPERVTVQPLDKQGGGDTREVLLLADDGTMLTKALWKRQKALLQTGELS